MGQPKPPLDQHRYVRDSRSQPICRGLSDGCYVYVQDVDGTIYILPDGPHMHPKVLGDANPAIYAGELRIHGDAIEELNNLSGTFQFCDEEGLLRIAVALEQMGFKILPGAVILFSHLDASRPRVLRY